MKIINSLYVTALLFLSFESNGQTYFAPGTAAQNGLNNTHVGNFAGSNSNLQFPFQNNINNVYLGFSSGHVASNSANNVAIGVYTAGNGATLTPSSADRNCFIGAFSGNMNRAGYDNVGLGYYTLRNNDSGINNVAIGSMSLFNNFISNGNVSIGSNSLLNFVGGSTVGDNTAIGSSSGYNFLTGRSNVFLGSLAGRSFRTGDANVFIGSQAGFGTTTTVGNYNIMIGANAGYSFTNSNFNILVGYQSGYSITTGGSNLLFGNSSGLNLITGGNNLFVGNNSGKNITTGAGNAFLGSVEVNAGIVPDEAGNNTSNTIILANGLGQQRLFIHSNGFAGFGLGNNKIPKNTLEIKALAGSPTELGFTASGLRLASLPNPNGFNTTPPSSNRKVLTTNTIGDVILVDDIGGGITSTCTTNFQIPVSNGTGNLSCSQIFDNGIGVGVGYSSAPTDTTFFDYNYNSIFYTNYTGGFSQATGAIKFHVNGNARANGIWTTSDKKFKKDIKSIDNALSTIEKLEGKTYLWNVAEFKDRNFDGGGHSGFIAQDLEKVLPHLVATTQNGDKAVNYIELMPYLVEAIKEQNTIIKDQQVQIDELKNQISNSFKAQNQDILSLENTKIISVSPNPSNDQIEISMNIEKSVQNANLQVHDLNGKLLNNLIINDRANNITRTLQKDNFGSGVYIVSLVVNGKNIDSKKIIFN